MISKSSSNRSGDGLMVRKMKVRKYILIGFFLTVIPLLLSYPPSSQYSGGGTLGFGREVVEFAKGTNYDQEAAIPSSPSVFVDIPTDWIGDQMFFGIYKHAI